ncbi:MAG: recombinase [Dorea sp.]|jgi:hypothetical protein|nr:recombinase [Dorea sp.]
MNDIEIYEKECKGIRETNEELLELFESDMTDWGLSDKTINRHLSNVNFYLNDYMLYGDAVPMEDGVHMLDMFLGDFFIRKCMWSTPATIKSTAASIKKFYQCMLKHGKIEKEDFEYLCAEIKDKMDEWQTNCAIYNDPDMVSPFGEFF